MLKTCPPPFPPSTCKWLKVTCVVHQGLLPTSRGGGCNSEAELSLPASKLKEEAGTVGDDTPTTSAAVEVSPQAQTPWTGDQDLFIKTSSQLPGDSPLLVGDYFCSSCCIFSLIPSFLFDTIEGLELGPALRFPYYKALFPLVLEKTKK